MTYRRNLKIIVGIVMVPIIIIAGAITISYLHENASRKLLASELTHLPSPPNCNETSRYYTSGDIDTVSNWTVKYNCKTTIGQASDFLVANLNKQGFIIQKDLGQSITSLSYTGHGFDVQYEYLGLSNRLSDNTPITPLTLIDLLISRHIQ